MRRTPARLTRSIRAVVLLTTHLLVASACIESDDDEVLRTASDATFPPFHMLTDDGRATGYDIELARLIAERSGFMPEVVVLPYDALFSGLIDNTHDVVAATTGITPEREAIYSFSAPYYTTCQAAVVRVDEDAELTLQSLERMRIGAAGAGTSMNAARRITDSYLSIDEGQGASLLLANEIDAWIVDEFAAVRTARESNGQLRVLPQPVALEAYGFVLRKNDDALRERLNEALQTLEEDGTVTRLQQQFDVERDADWPIKF